MVHGGCNLPVTPLAAKMQSPDTRGRTVSPAVFVDALFPLLRFRHSQFHLSSNLLFGTLDFSFCVRVGRPCDRTVLVLDILVRSGTLIRTDSCNKCIVHYESRECVNHQRWYLNQLMITNLVINDLLQNQLSDRSIYFANDSCVRRFSHALIQSGDRVAACTALYCH